ncbi:MAG TPA: glycine reductase [Casimicrobiaceae bacterium]|nr:glycine reductase [Casimicrobiaceae bacterium]
MNSARASRHGFAAPHDVPIPYLQRIRDYYQALGYGTPYEWAHYAEVPFHPLGTPLSKCRVALITTAAPYQPGKGDQGPRAPYNAKAKFYTVYSGDTGRDHDLRISHIAIDRKHTTAEDPGTYFPLHELRRSAATGRIGAIAARFHGIPTNRSHRVTLDIDCPEILARCKADGVDAAILVPNCPVCHQTVSLAARMLEGSGVSTVITGCAKDIVEHVGVPRFLFSDFPLGNATGRPRDPESQALTLDLALSVLERAPAPRTSVQSPLRWSEDADWKLDYCNIERLTPDEIARRRAEFDEAKSSARKVREDAELGRHDSADEIA